MTRKPNYCDDPHCDAWDGNPRTDPRLVALIAAAERAVLTMTRMVGYEVAEQLDLSLAAYREAPHAELRFCNKCGYHGPLKDHSGCDYAAYAVRPETPMPKVKRSQDGETGTE